jgi:uncharacterized membrane protein SpoIIM required for sporulation
MSEQLQEFLQRNRTEWQEFERLLTQAGEQGLEGLAEKDVRRFGRLYRGICGHLIQARSQFSNPETSDYLNDLVARAYVMIYQGREGKLAAAWRFYSVEFPRLFRAHHRKVLLSLAIFVVGAIVGYVAGVADPGSARYVLGGMAGLDTEKYLDSKGSLKGGVEEVGAMMTMVTINNLRVAALVLVGGLLFGAGSLVFQFFNGIFMGSFCSLFYASGKTYVLMSMLVPHGLVEVLGLFVEGAAGLILGGALLFPGERTRGRALREDGKVALRVFWGSLALTLSAMVVEATVSKFDVLGAELKYLFSLLFLGAVLAWLLLCGRHGASLKTGTS